MNVMLSDLRPEHPTPVSVRDAMLAIHAHGSEAISQDARAIGVSVDTHDIRPGEIFVAIPGYNSHGARYASQAVAAGACAVVTDEEGARIIGANHVNIPVCTVAHPREIVGPLAAEIAGHPAGSLTVAGITGTNGKTTTTFLLDAILADSFEYSAIVSTVKTRVGDKSATSKRTTAEASVLQRVLAYAKEQKCQAAAVEVSAHAVSLHRIDGMIFDAVGFSNLQHDHLDYYGDMEHYFAAKKALFTPEHARCGVVCIDDMWGKRLAREADIPVITVATGQGFSGPETPEASREGAEKGTEKTQAAHEVAKKTMEEADFTPDYDVHEVTPDTATGGTYFVLADNHSDATWKAFCPLPGRFNVQNAAIALLIAHQCGIDMDTAIARLAHAPHVPGRMEPVLSDCGDDPLIIVDYAHTPEALSLLTSSVRDVTEGKLHIVFGTDGDRDPSKREGVGEVAARNADILWVTDENPRTEDPASIRAQLLHGIARVRPGLDKVTEITTCRRDAVRTAILAAHSSDTVLITGKGPETYQEIHHCFHHYSDQEVARESLVGRAYMRENVS